MRAMKKVSKFSCSPCPHAKACRTGCTFLEREVNRYITPRRKKRISIIYENEMKTPMLRWFKEEVYGED